MLVDEVARPQEISLRRSGTRLNPRQSAAPERSEGCLCFGRGARDIYTRNARRRAQRSSLAEPAKLKLGPALPRACSTDSPIRPLESCC